MGCAEIVAAAVLGLVAGAVMLPRGAEPTEGKTLETAALILGLLAVQACVRIVLAVKSAAIPDVLVGKDVYLCRRGRRRSQSMAQ